MIIYSELVSSWKLGFMTRLLAFWINTVSQTFNNIFVFLWPFAFLITLVKFWFLFSKILPTLINMIWTWRQDLGIMCQEIWEAFGTCLPTTYLSFYDCYVKPRHIAENNENRDNRIFLNVVSQIELFWQTFSQAVIIWRLGEMHATK